MIKGLCSLPIQPCIKLSENNSLVINKRIECHLWRESHCERFCVSASLETFIMVTRQCTSVSNGVFTNAKCVSVVFVRALRCRGDGSCPLRPHKCHSRAIKTCECQVRTCRDRALSFFILNEQIKSSLIHSSGYYHAHNYFFALCYVCSLSTSVNFSL